MIRYLRLYGYFVRFAFSRAMEFRFDFFFRIIMDLIFYVVNIFFFKIIYLHSNTISHWTEPQTMIFVGVFITVDAIIMTVFANNIWSLPLMVNRGDLDYHLVRPVSSLFMVMLRDFAANSFVNLVMAISILVWAFMRYPEPFSWDQIAFFILLFLNGTVLYMLVYILFALPVFWTHSQRGFVPLFWGIEKFMERPHHIYTGALKIIFLTVLPFSLMASIPTDILFTDRPLLMVGYSCLITVLFFFAVIGIWRLGLKSYSSASS